MRFDDSLATVLSADTSTRFGAAATWRQLVDLMGRDRIVADAEALARLRSLRDAVPQEVRTASARALAFVAPGAALVGFFAEDEFAVAAPVLRTARLATAEWVALLPRLTPTQRSVLRHRRDLSADVGRALASFGSVDFVLPGTAVPEAAPEPDRQDIPAAAQPPVIQAPLSDTPFVALGEVARALPVVAEARRRTAEPRPATGGYAISDLVARIDAFNRRRDGQGEAAPAREQAAATSFRYRTDADGVVRWVEGVGRAALVGLNLARRGPQGAAEMDGSVAGAFRRRARFTDARLVIDSRADAAGAWRLSGVPGFDPASGRFVGYEGSARRPRADETAEPRDATRPGADSLRQLVHELRTPTNAIAGFAELIEREMLGPVPPAYRERAGTIRADAADLVAAIEDLDTAARIESDALELRAGVVEAEPLLARILGDLAPLAALRGAVPALVVEAPLPAMAVDDRAAERLVGRLLAAVIAAGSRGEAIGIAAMGSEATVTVAIDRPLGLVTDGSAEEADTAGAPLLGTGFALRLARRLATELGGSLAIDAERLTLRLPAALDREVGQTTQL